MSAQALTRLNPLAALRAESEQNRPFLKKFTEPRLFHFGGCVRAVVESAVPHDAWVFKNASGVMLTAPRNGQSNEIISTTTSASEVVTTAVITRCMRKS